MCKTINVDGGFGRICYQVDPNANSDEIEARNSMLLSFFDNAVQLLWQHKRFPNIMYFINWSDDPTVSLIENKKKARKIDRMSLKDAILDILNFILKL